MSISVFADKSIAPTPEDIRQALKDCPTWWERISAFMQQTYQLPGILQYGGKITAGTY